MIHRGKFDQSDRMSHDGHHESKSEHLRRDNEKVCGDRPITPAISLTVFSPLDELRAGYPSDSEHIPSAIV
jgi:hypothetical protein